MAKNDQKTRFSNRDTAFVFFTKSAKNGKTPKIVDFWCFHDKNLDHDPARSVKSAQKRPQKWVETQ